MNTNTLDFNTIFEQSTKGEELLRKLGSTGSGLHKLISNMPEGISSEIENKLRFIAATRNRALHEGIEHINCEREDYLNTCNLTYEYLESMMPVLKPDNSIIIDTILEMSLSEALQLISLGLKKITTTVEPTNLSDEQQSLEPEIRVQLSDISFITEEEDEIVVCSFRKLNDHADWLRHEISEAESGDSEYEIEDLQEKLERVEELLSNHKQ